MRTVEDLKNYLSSSLREYSIFVKNKSKNNYSNALSAIYLELSPKIASVDFSTKVKAADYFYSFFMLYPETIPVHMKAGFPVMRVMVSAMLTDVRLTDEYITVRNTLNEFLVFMDTI